jgi:hypothetical protein
VLLVRRSETRGQVMERTKTGQLLRIPLGRAAEVHDFVVRAISGHATATMHQRYSSVSDAEKRSGLAKVTALAGITAKVVIPVVIEGDPAAATVAPEMKKAQGYLGFSPLKLGAGEGT